MKIRTTFFLALIFLYGLNYAQQWQWAKLLSAPGYFNDEGQMATDAAGNFYLKARIDSGGLFEGIPINKGTFIAKFNSSGNIQWAKNFQDVSKIKFSNNNLYITGFYRGVLSYGSLSVSCNGYDDIYIAKLNTNGTVVDLRSFGGPGSDKGLGIDVNKNGRVFITGKFEDSLSFDSYKLKNLNNYRGFYAACLDTSLNTIWAMADTLTMACGYEVSADESNNCYTWSTYTDSSCFMYCRYESLSKFNSSGTKIKSQISNSYDSGYDLETVNNSLFIYGYDCNHQDCFTSAWKYDNQINMQWYKNWYDYYNINLTHAVVNSNKESVIAGSYGYAVQDSIKFDSVWVRKKGKDSDLMITKLDSTGKHLWFKTAGGRSDERIDAITTDNAGNYYVFGSIGNYSGNDTLIMDNDTLFVNGHPYQYFIAKLSTGVAAYVPSVVVKNADIHIYPNPSKGKLHFSNLQNGNLRVTNYLGQEITYKKYGEDIELDQPAGVYFAEVTIADKRTIKKIIIE